jgi:hypothetical protein
MIGIDVVEVEIRCLGVWFARHRQNVSRDAGPTCESDNCRAAIAAELVGGGDDTIKRRGNRHTVQFRQHRISSGAMAVACHDHRDLFSGQAALGRFATPLAGLSRHARSLALERFQNERLVAFNNSRQCLGFVASQGRQKSMSPAKRRGVMHAASLCGFGEADTVDHRLGLRRPLVLHAQFRQRRLCQGVERA